MLSAPLSGTENRGCVGQASWPVGLNSENLFRRVTGTIKMKWRSSQRLKWYFALSQATAYNYHRHIQVAVRSALNNTSLVPHFIYDGTEDFLTRWLRQRDVKVILHRVPFYDRFKSINNYNVDMAAGAFLRTQIPLIDGSDDIILYTDCDVMFLKQPICDLGSIRYFAAAPEFDQTNYSAFGMNTGVLFMNLERLRAIQTQFTEFLISNLETFTAFDQGAYRIVFDGLWERLDLKANWKPYWGNNRRAEIIHFHGPKYEHIKSLLLGHRIGWKHDCLFEANADAYLYYTKIFETYLTDRLVEGADPYVGRLVLILAAALKLRPMQAILSCRGGRRMSFEKRQLELSTYSLMVDFWKRSRLTFCGPMWLVRTTTPL
jgi:lipopolysaccharide biosynthesis glycosyltransferase